MLKIIEMIQVILMNIIVMKLAKITTILTDQSKIK